MRDRICFEQYVEQLDSYMQERVGFTTRELSEYDYFSDYSAGVAVEECASRAVIAAEGN